MKVLKLIYCTYFHLEGITMEATMYVMFGTFYLTAQPIIASALCSLYVANFHKYSFLLYPWIYILGINSYSKQSRKFLMVIIIIECYLNFVEYYKSSYLSMYVIYERYCCAETRVNKVIILIKSWRRWCTHIVCNDCMSNLEKSN